MKRILILTLLFATTQITFAQRSLPKVDLKTMDNTATSTAAFDNMENQLLLAFGPLGASHGKELNTIAEEYEDWVDETGVKIIAVSIDDSRNMSKVKPKVNAEMWEYEIYCDPNRDFARAMGVSSVPHTFLLNANKEIVWQHKGYVDGDEIELYEKIEELAH